MIRRCSLDGHLWLDLGLCMIRLWPLPLPFVRGCCWGTFVGPKRVRLNRRALKTKWEGE